jgi:hypothetical protein
MADFAHLGSGKTGWFAGLTFDAGSSPPASPLHDGDASESPLWSQDECYQLENRLTLARSNAGANRRVVNTPAVLLLSGAGKHRGEKTPSGQR